MTGQDTDTASDTDGMTRREVLKSGGMLSLPGLFTLDSDGDGEYLDDLLGFGEDDSSGLTILNSAGDVVAEGVTSLQVAEAINATTPSSSDDGDGLKVTLDANADRIASLLDGKTVTPNTVRTSNLAVEQGRGLLGLPAHHINYGSGLSSNEMARFSLETDEVLEVWRLEAALSGGGKNSDVEIDVYDATAGTVLASTTGGVRSTGGDTPLGTSTAGATILARISTGSNEVTLTPTGIVAVVSE